MAIKKEIDGRGSDNIFYPEKLSPQGFLTDFITAQIHSNAAPFPELKQIIYQNDFLSKVNNKLVFLHPKDDKDLLVKDGKLSDDWIQQYFFIDEENRKIDVENNIKLESIKKTIKFTFKENVSVAQIFCKNSNFLH